MPQLDANPEHAPSLGRAPTDVKPDGITLLRTSAASNARRKSDNIMKEADIPLQPVL